MKNRKKLLFSVIILLAAFKRQVMADMNVQLTTTDGSTKFAIQNSAASQVASVDSLGNATFNKVTTSSITMPNGGSITIGTVKGSVVPSGTLILTTSTCPSGFTEYTGAGGFYLVGVPSGGTVGGTVGSAMTNQSNATHNHTVTTATGNFINTLGSVAAVTSVTSPTGDVARGTVAPYFQIRLCSVP